MDSDSRQRLIVEFARERGRVEVPTLAEELQVATETIRRDLKVLAGRRLLKRVHGGAVPLETVAFESGVEYRSQVDLAQHLGVDQATVSRIERGAPIARPVQLLLERLASEPAPAEASGMSV